MHHSLATYAFNTSVGSMTLLGLPLAMPAMAQDAPESPHAATGGTIVAMAIEALCLPFIDRQTDFDALTEGFTATGLAERKPSPFPSMRWAWDMKPAADAAAVAVLHAGVGDDGACTLAYDVLDEGTPTDAVAASFAPWASALPGFVESKAAARMWAWKNAQSRTELLISTGYIDGVVFAQYSRR